jgi:hypothetical protein
MGLVLTAASLYIQTLPAPSPPVASKDEGEEQSAGTESDSDESYLSDCTEDEEEDET